MRKAAILSFHSLLLGGLFVAGCMPEQWRGSGKRSEQSQVRLAAPPVIAVLPMRAGSRLPVSGTQAVCHLTGEHFEPGPVSAENVKELDREVSAALAERALRVVPSSLVVEWIAGADPLLLSNYERSLGAEVARATGAEFSLMGVVVRYRERSGTWWASGSPASVAFTLVLVEVKTGKIVWSYRYDKVQTPVWRGSGPVAWSSGFRSQEPLATDLYPLPWWDNFRWLTRRDLARRGVAAALDSLVRQLERSQPLASSGVRKIGLTQACEIGVEHSQGGSINSCLER